MESLREAEEGLEGNQGEEIQPDTAPPEGSSGQENPGPGPSGHMRGQNHNASNIPIEEMTAEQLMEECRSLSTENMSLKQQLQRKEEQRLTAIRLLKQAKKRHEQSKLGQEMAKNISGKEKGGENNSPQSQAGSHASFAPPPSIAGSIMSLGRHSFVGAYRKSTGLKELLDPDTRLVQVLQKLSSDQVLSSLENIVDKLHKEGGNSSSSMGLSIFSRK